MKEYPISELNQVKRGANRATYKVEKINAILDVGFLAYVSFVFDGKAICLPMAYGRIEDKVYIHGSRKNRMLLALLEAKEISMTVMHLDGLVLARSAFHHSVNYRSATLFGKVILVDEPIKKEKALKQVVDQMIPNRWEELRPMNEKEFNGTLVVEMTIETASAKIRDDGAIDEKSDLNFPVWAGVVPLRQTSESPISDNLLAENIEVPEHISNYYQQNKCFCYQNSSGCSCSE